MNQVSNEKFYKVKTLQDLIARDQAKFKIASHCKSSPQFSPEDIHVEVNMYFLVMMSIVCIARPRSTLGPSFSLYYNYAKAESIYL